jgi:hypothetical protein
MRLVWRFILFVALPMAVAACWMGDPVSYLVVVDNRTSSELHFKAEVDRGVNLVERVPANQKGDILYSQGRPAKSDVIFRGGLCTTVDVVAYDSAEHEVARHPPGLCISARERDTWVIGEPGSS